MLEYGFSLSSIFPHKGRIEDSLIRVFSYKARIEFSVLIRENAGQRRPLFWHNFGSVEIKWNTNWK